MPSISSPIISSAFLATTQHRIIAGETPGRALDHRLSEDSTLTVAVVKADSFYQVENRNVSIVPAYNQDYNFITLDSHWDGRSQMGTFQQHRKR
jgi:hypothetical protein